VLGERALDSRTGRFLQRDPVTQTASSIAAHPYAFAWNNPASYVDPTGAEPENAGPAGLGAALGRMLQEEAFKPGAKVEPYIETKFSCNFDRNCMKAIEEFTGSLTEFEQQLKAEFHVTRKTVFRWAPRYHLVVDRLSGAVLGYAFFLNNLEIYNRQGGVMAMINNERPLETPLLDPIDFISGGIGSWVQKKIATVVGRSAVQSTMAASGKVPLSGAFPPKKIPPYNLAKPGELAGRGYGYTTWMGEIFIDPAIKAGSGLFNYTIKHEGMHRFLSPRGGLFAPFRANVKAFFYKRSHLLRYTEEALAEYAATHSVRWAARYPFRHPQLYGISTTRLVLEGAGAAVGIYGGYQLTEGWLRPDK
jgi:hypothetical protein